MSEQGRPPAAYNHGAAPAAPAARTVNGSPVMRSVQFLALTFSSCTASYAYTWPDVRMAAIRVCSLNTLNVTGQ